MCSFDGVQKDNYFRGELIKRIGIEVRIVVDWIWKLCNITFESGVVPKVCCNCSSVLNSSRQSL